MTAPSTEASTPVTLLHRPERHPLRPATHAQALDRVLVLAPHPDDESLGCGGLLALLARTEQPARVLVMTDGARSHPNSQRYPPRRLRALREAETRAALAHLGLPAGAARFLRYPDCELPAPGAAAFDAVVERLQDALTRFRTDTVLVPWRRDPHCDHEFTWHLACAAARRMARPPRWLEYPVWAWEHPEAAPRPDEAAAWRLDIATVAAHKQRAIRAHRSQTTRLIDDDPDGFQLEPAMLRHFEPPWELFLKPFDVPM